MGPMVEAQCAALLAHEPPDAALPRLRYSPRGVPCLVVHPAALSRLHPRAEMSWPALADMCLHLPDTTSRATRHFGPLSTDTGTEGDRLQSQAARQEATGIALSALPQAPTEGYLAFVVNNLCTALQLAAWHNLVLASCGAGHRS